MKEVVATHIGSYGILIKDNKYIALIKKARGGYTGKLDLPGGGIEHEENPVDALYREVNEEIGGTVIEYKLLDVASSNIKWQMEENIVEDLHHIGILYEIKIKEDNLKEEADGIDSNGANWYLIKDLTKEELTPFASKAINIVKEKNNG